jgi:hypothetical protein
MQGFSLPLIALAVCHVLTAARKQISGTRSLLTQKNDTWMYAAFLPRNWPHAFVTFVDTCLSLL